MKQQAGTTTATTTAATMSVDTTSVRSKRRMLCALVGTVVVASTHALSTGTTTSRPSLVGSSMDGTTAVSSGPLVDFRGQDMDLVMEMGPAVNVAPLHHSEGPLAMSGSPDNETLHSDSGNVASSGGRSDAERQNLFELQVGRAIDTLRRDYPEILQRPPDYNLYSPNLVTIDPSGVQLTGLTNYKNAFRLVHTVVNLFYCPEKSLLTYRMVYDHEHQDLRVSWNVAVIPKAFFGRKKLHIDGISVYHFDREGRIVQHKVEQLVMNNSFVRPEKGIMMALKSQLNDRDGVPVLCTDPNTKAVAKFHRYGWGRGSIHNNHNAASANTNSLADKNRQDRAGRSTTSLYAVADGASANEEKTSSDDNDNTSSGNTAGSSSKDDASAVEIDLDALERKNMSRKKFGMKPLSPDEFLELQTKVHEMENEAQRQQAAAAQSSDATNYPKEKKKGFLKGLFGNILDDTCETNYDCVRPELCCDFGFKKMCCSSGSMISTQQRGMKQPVRVVAGYPPGTVPEDW